MSYYCPETDTQQLKREIRRLEKLLKRGRMNAAERELLEENLEILRQDLDYSMEYA